MESVEQPIKDGIKVFDDQKREEKRKKAVEIAAEVAADAELNEKYAARLDILDKYTNLTATAKAIKEDLETRAFALKVEQDREADRLQIIQSVLAGENERLATKMQLSLWQRDIDNDVPTSEIIEKIKAQAAVVYDAENKPVEPATEQQPTEMPPQEEKQPEEAQEQPEVQQYKVTFEIVGDYETQHRVSNFLKENDIFYTVVNQKKL